MKKIALVAWVALFLVLGAYYFMIMQVSKSPDPNVGRMQQPQMQEQEGDSILGVQEGVTTQCNNLKKIEGLKSSNDKTLKALNDYQDLCGSFVTDHMMIFSPFPSDEKAAEKIAKKISSSILEFQKFGIVPVIVMEPADENGYVSLGKIASGEFQDEMETMFQRIEEMGADPAKQQIWIPYPEINTPIWNKQGFRPQNFSKIVNDFDSALRKRFPKAKIGVLLNAKSYYDSEAGWEGGSYRTFDEYLKGFEKGKIDFFVIQGFPWIPSANQQGVASLVEPQVFLRSDLALEAARSLDVQEVWINSGTFNEIYARDPQKFQKMSSEKRKQILHQIVSVAESIQKQGFRTRIHLFADNKKDENEAINWSYFPNQDGHGDALFSFIHLVYAKNLDFSIFDNSD